MLTLSHASSAADDFHEYRLLGLLGKGAMGQVFRAHDTILDRPVAVKLVNAAQPDATARRRFLTEARAIARLLHPNVVTIFRVGEHKGQPFLVSELIDGRSLAACAKPMPWEQVLAIGIGMARGIGAAHRHGVLHRDIKPANVMLGASGEVKILDFGLAKLAPLAGSEPDAEPNASADAEPNASADAEKDGDVLARTASLAGVPPPEDMEAATPRAPSSLARLTATGTLVGTPLYMAPETWRGEDATPRTDIYSLGAVLYELLSGRPPHDLHTLEELRQSVLERDAPALASVVPDVHAGVAGLAALAALIDRCLHRDPAQRPTADELGLALERLEHRDAPVPAGNPYRGLHPFEARDRALFFGRGADIRAIVELLAGESLVIVAGDSGVGKSSVCRAGVLPQVARHALGPERDFAVLSMVPGPRPLHTLIDRIAPRLDADPAALLAQATGEPARLVRRLGQAAGRAHGIVLFVDQLEELVTRSAPDQAAAFGEALGHLSAQVPGVRVLATARGDFLTRLVQLPGLAAALHRGMYLLRPLSPEDVREAITGPARVHGVGFESERMVDDLVAAAAPAEGGLPLLQFALAALWEARDRGRDIIPAAALDRIGGVAGALARHADDVLARCRPAVRRAARRILLALITVQGARITRTSRHEHELLGDRAPGPGHDAQDALAMLVKGRLLVAREADDGAGATYDLAHEALIHGWGTLRRWLDTDGDRRALIARIEAAAAEWQHQGRAREPLWSERQLAELDAVALSEEELRAREVDFVRASRRRVRQRRRRRRALAIGIPLAMAAIYGGIELQMQRTRGQAVAAHVREAAPLRTAARAQDQAHGDLRRRAFDAFDAGDVDTGEATWARALDAAGQARRLYRQASSQLEAALFIDSSARVQQQLAALLYAQALLAERLHDHAWRDELIDRLRAWDDGPLLARWSAPATLALTTQPADAHVAIGRYVDEDGYRALGPALPAGVPLAPGSYLVELAAAGHAPVRYPVVLARGEEHRAHIALPPASAVPAGFVYIPAGRFLLGSAADEAVRRDIMGVPPLHAVRTSAYLIGRTEVTMGQWLAFVRDLPAAEQARRLPRAETIEGTVKVAARPDGAFELILQPTAAGQALVAREGEPLRYPGRERRTVQDWLAFPVSGISWDDAHAYAGWLDRTGRVPGARLCTEREWERAARGADDRAYPHGDRLAPDDANHDVTYGRDPASFGPDQAGAHPASTSPFGLVDMAGNVWEWLVAAGDEHAVRFRGGSWYQQDINSLSANGMAGEPGLRHLLIGLRMCATPTWEQAAPVRDP